MASACQKALGLPGDRLRAASAVAPWARFDSTTARSAFLLLQVVPNIVVSACAGNDAAEAALVARGIALGERPTYSPLNDARRATLHVARRQLTPAIYGRVPVQWVTRLPSAAPIDDAMQLRLYLAPSDIEPDTLGRFAGVVVRVFGPGGIEPDVIEIPGAVLSEAWQDLLGWRLARLATGTQPRTPTVGLPTPADRELREAHRSYVDGNAVGAAMLAQERLRVAPISRDDARYARMQLALTLLDNGDLVGGRVMLAHVLRDAPCLTLPGRAPPMYQRILEQLRPTARCSVVPSQMLLARGLIFPGLAQVASARQTAAIAVASVTATAFGGAALRHLQAEDRFSEYVDATNGAAATQLHRQATNLRRDARTLAFAGAAVWIVGAVEAVVVESIRGRRISRVRNYGGVQPLLRTGAWDSGGPLVVGGALRF